MCTVSLMCRRIATPFMVLLFALAGSPGAAQPARLDCLPLLQERLKLVEALNKLESVELPSDKIRDMQAFVAELKSALGDTGTDAATAAKKIEDAIDKIKRVLPQAEGPLKQIAKALKDTKASIEEVLKPIDAFGTALDIVDKFYQQTESGSAADLVRALGSAFDQIRSVLPIKAVPGLNALFDAYKQSIDAIAASAARIEDRVREMNATMREVQNTSGDELGILVPVYLPADGPRGKLAKQKLGLEKMLAALDARLNSMGCHPPGSPNTPDFTADPCAPSKDARATIALETAKRRVAALERQADQARTDMLEAWGRMQSPAILDASAQSDVEAAEVALARAEATVAELARDIERAKKREAWLKDAATRVTGAERESWEKSARDEWMKYTVLEQQDLPRARRTVDRARAALAKERSEAPQARAAYEAAKARYQAARTSFESVLVQIEQAIAAVLAQAADLEKWALAERLTLARCRDHFPQEHYKRAIDKALADLGADPSGQCSPASPQPGTKGIAGHIGGVANQIGAAGCR